MAFQPFLGMTDVEVDPLTGEMRRPPGFAPMTQQPGGAPAIAPPAPAPPTLYIPPPPMGQPAPPTLTIPPPPMGQPAPAPISPPMAPPAAPPPAPAPAAPAPAMEPSKRILAELETSGGSNLLHETITDKDSAHFGMTAGGAWGIMPLTFREVVNRDPLLKKQYGELAKKTPDEITAALNADPQMDDAVASVYWEHIRRNSGDDPARASVAWLGGLGGLKFWDDIRTGKKKLSDFGPKAAKRYADLETRYQRYTEMAKDGAIGASPMRRATGAPGSARAAAPSFAPEEMSQIQSFLGMEPTARPAPQQPALAQKFAEPVHGQGGFGVNPPSTALQPALKPGDEGFRWTDESISAAQRESAGGATSYEQGFADASPDELVGGPQVAAAPGAAATPEDDLRTRLRGVQAGIDKQKEALGTWSEEQKTALAQMKSDLLQGKIDPRGWWNNASTPTRIVAVLGAALGGFSAGLTGGPNAALQMIQSAIDNDIAAQRDEMGMKQNAYSEALRLFGDDEKAKSALIELDYSMVDALLREMALEAKGAGEAGAGKIVGEATITKMSDWANAWTQVEGVMDFFDKELSDYWGPDFLMRRGAEIIPGTKASTLGTRAAGAKRAIGQAFSGADIPERQAESLMTEFTPQAGDTGAIAVARRNALRAFTIGKIRTTLDALQGAGYDAESVKRAIAAKLTNPEQLLGAAANWTPDSWKAALKEADAAGLRLENAPAELRASDSLLNAVENELALEAVGSE